MKENNKHKQETSEVIFLNPEDADNINLEDLNNIWAQISENLANK